MTRKYTSLQFTEYPVATGHYDTTRLPITKIVLHSSASTRQGLINTFGGGTRMVSAHYGIDNDGSILAFLEEYNTAFAVGNYKENQSSLSLEHIDNGSEVRLHTDAQYVTSIQLVADLCKFYNLPADREHIVPHSSIVNTACPNGLDVNRIINGAKAILSPSPVPSPSTIDLGGLQTPLETYGVIEIETLKSKLLAKDSKIKSDEGNIAVLAKRLYDLVWEKSILFDKLATMKDIKNSTNWWWIKYQKIMSLLS